MVIDVQTGTFYVTLLICKLSDWLVIVSLFSLSCLARSGMHAKAAFVVGCFKCACELVSLLLEEQSIPQLSVHSD